MSSFMGIIRPDGRVGIREHVLVIATVSCANGVVGKICSATGAIPILHEGGCMEFEENSQRTALVLQKAGQNPNVAAALIVGLGCEQIAAGDIASAIAATGTPTESLLIQSLGGAPEAVQEGVAIVSRLRRDATGRPRVPCPLSSLVVGMQCGGSDWTTVIAGNPTLGIVTDMILAEGGSVLLTEVTGLLGSEHLLVRRAINHRVGLQILDLVDSVRSHYRSRYGQSVEEINPTPGNKAGGISTLVEKSAGNIMKSGTGPIQGVLELGESIPHPGLWIIDSECHGPDIFSVSTFAIQGAHATIFSTGRGTPLGCALMPVIKVTGNPDTYSRMASIIDFNSGAVLEGSTVEETGHALFKYLIEVASGSGTRSEVNEQLDFAIPKITR